MAKWKEDTEGKNEILIFLQEQRWECWKDNTIKTNWKKNSYRKKITYLDTLINYPKIKRFHKTQAIMEVRNQYRKHVEDKWGKSRWKWCCFLFLSLFFSYWKSYLGMKGWIKLKKLSFIIRMEFLTIF